MHQIFIYFLILFSVFATSCNKPNPHPETLDPIYADFQKELDDTKKNLEAEQKNMEDLQKSLEKVQPQTGQIKYATKRLYESRDRLSKLSQLVKYWEIKLVSRQKEAKDQYLKAWNSKKPWPNPNEYEEYLQVKKSRNIPPMWDVKARIQNSELGTLNKKAKPMAHEPSGGHDSSSAAEPPEHH